MRFLVVLVASSLTLVGCGGGGAAESTDPTADAPSFTQLEIAPTSAVVPVGGSVQFTAFPTDSAGNPVSGLPNPTYKSSHDPTATVDQTGLVTGVAPGNVVITATLTAGEMTRTASAPVTVTSGARAPNTITTPGIAFDPNSLTVAVGDTVTWEFSGAVHNVMFTGNAPPGGNIPDQQVGSVVTRAFPSAGTFGYECTIHAGMAGEVIVESTTAPVFSSVAVTPATPSIVLGDTVRLIATPLDQFGSAMTGLPSPSFVSSDDAIATVDGNGLVNGVGEGSAAVSASVTSEGVTHTGSSTVTVTSPQSGAVTVTTPGLRFDPESVTVPVGGTVTWQFSEAVHNVTFAGASPTGGDIPDQDPGNAVSRTFTSAGTFNYECTRHNGMVGEIVVQADGGPQSFSAVSLTPGQWAMRRGATKQLMAIPVDQNGLPMDGLPTATFVTSDPAVATVDVDGTVSGLSLRAATITASISADGVTHSATMNVDVVSSDAVVVTIEGGFFNPDRVEIAPGGTVIWELSGTAHNMTFDVVPPGGNIPNVEAGDAVARTFPDMGDYDYTCTLHGEKGRVRVR